MKLRAHFIPRDGKDSDWDTLRSVRNSCREGLTHTRTEITPEEQALYRQSYSENVRHYLYVTTWGWVVGFSRLEWIDGFVYPTYGVASWARGHGFSWEIVKHAMLAAGGPLKGDLLVSNEAIKKVDYALGWRPVGEPHDGIQDVEADWPPAFAQGVFE